MPSDGGPGQSDTDTATNADSASDTNADSDNDNDNGRVLAREREHLRSSRECLRLMREDVLGLKAMAADRVSQEYLKADLYHRAEALKDIPDAPLFFGRLDYAPGARLGGEGGRTSGAPIPAYDSGDLSEEFHIGRRHIHDREGHPVVIDWRAPVSRPFYRASQADPMSLLRRRRFGFAGGELTAYEDEEFRAGTAGGRPAGTVPPGTAQPGTAQPGTAQPGTAQPGTVPPGPAPAPTSRILIEEIERPRSGPMRDIVATIQPDQDEIVRASADETVCVQGAPGTGKTAVGLHRVAYLLYAHHNRMLRGGVLVIGPNRAFLSYIRNVLPALGETDVTQVTVADLVAGVPVRAVDAERAARVKGDARMADVLRRALWSGVNAPQEQVLLVRGSRRWRVSATEVADLIAELRERGVRYGPGREMLGHRIAHVILTRMEAAGESCDDRTHDAVRRTKAVRAAVDALWPAADPVRLVFRLLSDPALLAESADGILDTGEQQAIAWHKPPRGPGSARWTAADAVLIDEARDLIERTPSLAHVVVDEAQDLSPMECRAVGRRCATGSATVLGDVAQATTAAAVADWPRILAYLGKPEAPLRVLDVGYRVPRQILDFASLLLPRIAPGLSPARSLRQDPGAADVLPVTPDNLPSSLVAACRQALSHPGSAAVIAADGHVATLAQTLATAGIDHDVLNGAGLRTRLTLVPVTLAKGLEFDHVIVAEPAQIVAAHPRGLHHLYVALTRAVSRLTVIHAEPLPDPLRGGGPCGSPA